MTTRILHFIAFILFLNHICIAQDKPEPLIYFEEFQALGNNQFFLFSEDQPYIGSILDTSNGKLTPEIIRKGRGPFEIEQFGGASYNTSTGFLYVTDIGSGRILKLVSQGNGIAENTLPLPFVTHLDAYKSTLILSAWVVLDKSMRKDVSNHFPIAYLADPENLAITDTLFFDMELLKVNSVKDVDKIEWFTLHPKILSLDQDDMFLVAFQNFDYLFLVNSRTNVVEQTISLNIPNSVETLIHFSQRFNSYGQISYSILNDYIRHGDAIYFAFGDKEINIPYGLVEIVFDEKGIMTHKMLMLENDINELGYELNITTDGKRIFGTDGTKVIPLTFKEHEQD